MVRHLQHVDLDAAFVVHQISRLEIAEQGLVTGVAGEQDALAILLHEEHQRGEIRRRQVLLHREGYLLRQTGNVEWREAGA